jgi:L-iditol 2-dehydrogenase
VVLVQPNTKPKEQAEKIKTAAGDPLKLALECTGVESSVQTAIFVSSAALYRAYVTVIVKTFLVYEIWRKSVYHWSGEKRTVG